MQIREGGLDDPQVLALLQLHLESMHAHSPPESVHALDVGHLKRPEISFWTAWEDDRLLGCAALREIDPTHGEIKSMRTDPGQLRRGTGAALLRHILEVARGRGYRRLSLETGTGPAFEAAHGLYRQFGFTDCGPLAGYPADDPFSRFLSRVL
ncbi:GNAT family N-acetyltransferase [Sphingomonas xinjiangensis]|uniref:Putative acetyltransferase n=1 Tax=Sphingomonas xinjiangensis TaxID=643568 RepID=A0A840YJV1_9SPHN|nr:GNAT family N-acetyltransferase [Sphingomonas xinjiangensis]MBB5711328.1 putative acetyltransferase [Sphingomonas xinjiangensis]